PWELGVSAKGFKFEPRLDTANFFQESASANATLDSINTSRPSRTTADLEFVSIVVPIVKDVTFAAYRAVNLRYQLAGDDLAGGNYRVFFVNRAGSQSISLDEQGGLDLRSTVYGASLGARFGPV